MKDNFDVTYHCSCVHEISQDGLTFTPTGNDKLCKYHREMEVF